MHKLLCAAALGAATLAAGNACAERNWYAGIEGGITFPEKSGIEGLGSNMDGNVSYKDGYVFGGVLGYDFGGFRLEGEAAHRYNKAKEFNINNDGGVGAAAGTGPLIGRYDATGGASKVTSGMANGYVDIGKDWVVHPYLGAGIGAAEVKFSDMRVGPADFVQGSKTVLAYQGIAGFRWAVSDAVDLVADYRYFATGHINVGDGRDFGVRVNKYRSHTVMIGLHFKFGQTEQRTAAEPTPAPAPAPVAEPAPAPAPEAAVAPIPAPFLVYFDWDKSDLTPDAEKMVVDAGNTAKTHGFAQIRLRGHADTSGPAEYNLGLSQRRADTVKSVLIREGIPADHIMVRALGETELMVPTPDGVREPKNRVVEIIMEK